MTQDGTSAARARWTPLAVGLLNATGTGAGYLWIRRRRRAACCWVGTALLLITAGAVNAADSPGRWAVIYLLWLAGMAFDGWDQAAGAPDAVFVSTRPWLPFALAAVLLAAVAGGLAAYRAVPERELSRADAAHAAGDCGTALASYERAARTRYEFTLTPVPASARWSGQSCQLVLTAEQTAAEGEFYAAASSLDRYQSRYPDGAAPWPEAGPREAEYTLAYIDTWAASAAVEANSWRGRGGYRYIFELYYELREEHPESPEAGRVPERIEGFYADALAAVDGCAAPDRYREFRQARDTFDDDPTARRIGDDAAAAIPGAVYDCGAERLRAGRYCRAISAFQEAAELESAAPGLRARAEEQLVQSRYECARWYHEEYGDQDIARQRFLELIEDYPGHPRAEDAAAYL